MKFNIKNMFSKNNEEKKVLVDLQTYEKLEKDRIDSNLEIYKSRETLRVDKEFYDKTRNNDIQVFYDKDIKFSEVKKEIDEENKKLIDLKVEVQVVDQKNKLVIDQTKFLTDKFDLNISLKDKEIALLKENQTSALKNRDEIIDLLKTQVEVLTAKLTEIKISDAHIHVDAKVGK